MFRFQMILLSTIGCETPFRILLLCVKPLLRSSRWCPHPPEDLFFYRIHVSILIRLPLFSAPSVPLPLCELFLIIGFAKRPVLPTSGICFFFSFFDLRQYPPFFSHRSRCASTEIHSSCFMDGFSRGRMIKCKDSPSFRATFPFLFRAIFGISLLYFVPQGERGFQK